MTQVTSAATLSRVWAVALVGLEARAVQIECTRVRGLPGMRIVGLADTAVREAEDRIRTAVQRCGLKWPVERVVVNLAPADLPKIGTGFDLPLAIAVLAASDQVPLRSLDGLWACGELGLDGTVRAVPGTLPTAMGVERLGGRRLLVADGAAAEAGLAQNLDTVAVKDLAEVVDVLRGTRTPRQPAPLMEDARIDRLDLADVRGQAVACRAVELAAAGGHHLLLIGPPGCGKTMLAHRLHGLLPPLQLDEALEVASLESLVGDRRPEDPLRRVAPLREPHHSMSLAGLVGGGSGVPRPGELALAHRGVLLLDEVLETPRWLLDALRQPLEKEEIVLTRSRATVRYPCRVLLVAAANPCPCGQLGARRGACACRPDMVSRYRSRLSGPLADRIDLHVGMQPVPESALVGTDVGDSSDVVAARVAACRAVAEERWGRGLLNRDAGRDQLMRGAQRESIRVLMGIMSQFALSARGFDRFLRVARTIADLDGSELIRVHHVEEALAYRVSADPS